MTDKRTRVQGPDHSITIERNSARVIVSVAGCVIIDPCSPYKGDCACYRIPIGAARSINAAWNYEAPYPTVAEVQAGRCEIRLGPRKRSWEFRIREMDSTPVA
jgi:uncharacterized protein (DUF427 family)